MFTEEQKAELSAPLSRSNVEQRKQGGRQVSYIEAWHAINEANRIFGFDGWDRDTHYQMVNQSECIIGEGKSYEKPGWRVTYIAKVTIKVGRPGVYREGCGAGHGIDADLGQAHESALKEAESDAMKRALMTFGNPFGLALYDKSQANVASGSSAPPSSQRNGNGFHNHQAPADEESFRKAKKWADGFLSIIQQTPDEEYIRASLNQDKNSRALAKLKAQHPAIHADLEACIEDHIRGLTP